MNYNVNWTYGGDGSKHGGGYAALHGCQGDTVTFNFAGGVHNVVELDYSVAKSASRHVTTCMLAQSPELITGMHAIAHP